MSDELIKPKTAWENLWRQHIIVGFSQVAVYEVYFSTFCTQSKKRWLVWWDRYDDGGRICSFVGDGYETRELAQEGAIEHAREIYPTCHLFGED